MPNQKITDLTPAASVAADTLFEVVTDPSGTPVSESATASQMVTFSGANNLVNSKEFWLLPATLVLAGGHDYTSSIASHAIVQATSAGLLYNDAFRTQDFDTDQAFYSNANDDVFFNHRVQLYIAARLDDGGSNSRCWLGFVDGAATALKSTDTPAVSVIAFRASSSVPDATWKAVVGNGGAQTVADTGVAISTTATQHFRIEWGLSATSVQFYINNVLVATIITTLPAATDSFRYVMSVTCVSGGFRRFISFSEVRGQHSNVA